MTIITPTVTSMADLGVLYIWGMMKAGDVGSGIEIWAWPQLCFHLTGNTDGHSVDVLGSNDGSCFGPLFTLDPRADWVNDHLHDTIHDASGLPRVRWMMTIVRGPGNTADCSVALFGSRHF